MKKTSLNFTKTGLAVLFGGLSAGILNGLFGTGGGIVILFLLSRLYADSEIYAGKDLFAMTLFCIFPMSLCAFLRYGMHGYAAPSDVKSYLLPAILGGLLGAFLLGKLRLSAVKRLFALLVIFAGITMLLR